MHTTKVAKRYAAGLFDFANEQGLADRIGEDMVRVKDILKNSPDLVKFLGAPYIDSKKKLAVSKEIFRELNPVSQNLIQMVIKHGRESDLMSMAGAYKEKLDQINGVQNIQLTIATQLSDTAIQKILSESPIVDHQRAKNVNVKVNPDIIGGYILRVGDQQIDASVKSQLVKIEKSFQV